MFSSIVPLLLVFDLESSVCSQPSLCSFFLVDRCRRGAIDLVFFLSQTFPQIPNGKIGACFSPNNQAWSPPGRGSNWFQAPPPCSMSPPLCEIPQSLLVSCHSSAAASLFNCQFSHFHICETHARPPSAGFAVPCVRLLETSTSSPTILLRSLGSLRAFSTIFRQYFCAAGLLADPPTPLFLTLVCISVMPRRTRGPNRGVRVPPHLP